MTIFLIFSCVEISLISLSLVSAAVTAILDTSAPATSKVKAATPVSPILASSPTYSTSESGIGSVEVVGQSPPSTLGHGDDLTTLTTIKENERIVESQLELNKVHTVIDVHRRRLS